MNKMNVNDESIVWDAVLRHHSQALESSVDELGNFLKAEKRPIERYKLIEILREYEKKGLGTFKEGRRGKKSRILWRSNPSALNSPLPLGGGLAGSDGVKILEFPILLRPGLIIKVPLPEDLSSAEAERIALFIKSLPLPNPVP